MTTPTIHTGDTKMPRKEVEITWSPDADWSAYVAQWDVDEDEIAEEAVRRTLAIFPHVAIDVDWTKNSRLSGATRCWRGWDVEGAYHLDESDPTVGDVAGVVAEFVAELLDASEADA